MYLYECIVFMSVYVCVTMCICVYGVSIHVGLWNVCVGVCMTLRGCQWCEYVHLFVAYMCLGGMHVYMHRWPKNEKPTLQDVLYTDLGCSSWIILAPTSFKSRSRAPLHSHTPSWDAEDDQFPFH